MNYPPMGGIAVNIKFISEDLTQRRGDAKNAEFKKGFLIIFNLFIPFAPSAPLRLCERFL